MAEQEWTLKGSKIDPEDVAKIACALKSLAAYTSIALEEDDNPEELRQVVDDGLAAIERVFVL